jgi:hypothetical protein
MGQEERAAAVQEAIEFGIYAGSLPPSPIEVTKAEGPIFFDVETGLPLTFEEVARRGVCVYRSLDSIPLYPHFEKSSLKKALFKFQQDQTLDTADREHLKPLAADERLEEHWSYIGPFSCISWSVHLARLGCTPRGRIRRGLSRKTAARAECGKSCPLLEK